MKTNNEEIKKNDFMIEMAMNEPTIILWSVIEELRDIHEWYLPNLFTYIKHGKKARKHLVHQIERLEIILNALEKE